MDPFVLIVLAVAAGILFDITNGWNDSANAIATVVSTRVMSPWQALGLSAVLNFVGALASVKVAKTMGSGVVDLPVALSSVAIVLAAMLAASGWVTWCPRLGLPISCSHSLVGGLVGAAVGSGGWATVKWAGLNKILIALLASPLIGMVLGYLFIVAVSWMARGMTPRMGRKTFGKLQIFSASFMAFQHGQNDAQKVMGVLSLALFVGGFLHKDGIVITNIADLYIPTWVILACASAMAFGTAVGGWRVIQTIGSKLSRITPVEGFAAETAGGLVLEIAAKLGVPVSTTHTITGAIVGVGAAKGAHAVQWGIGAKILSAWFFTLPTCFVLGALLSWLSTRTSPMVMTGAVVAVTVVTFALARFRRKGEADALQ